MFQQIEIKVSPDKIDDIAYQRQCISDALGLGTKVFEAKLIKRSIDARKFPAIFLLRFEIFID